MYIQSNFSRKISGDVVVVVVVSILTSVPRFIYMETISLALPEEIKQQMNDLSLHGCAACAVCVNGYEQTRITKLSSECARCLHNCQQRPLSEHRVSAVGTYPMANNLLRHSPLIGSIPMLIQINKSRLLSDDNAFTPTPKKSGKRAREREGEGSEAAVRVFVVCIKCTHLVFVFWSMVCDGTVCTRANAVKLSQYKMYRFFFGYLFSLHLLLMVMRLRQQRVLPVHSLAHRRHLLLSHCNQCDAMRKRKYRESLRYSTHLNSNRICTAPQPPRPEP